MAKQQINVALSVSTVELLDAYIAEIEEKFPGLSVSRSAAAAALLNQALGKKDRIAQEEAPATTTRPGPGEVPEPPPPPPAPTPAD